ncbi:MAG: hypothetical protein JXR86_17485 [Spirochaetales bacterium]|nr:hypothetical protein [Spirochaetales bacterium]
MGSIYTRKLSAVIALIIFLSVSTSLFSGGARDEGDRKPGSAVTQTSGKAVPGSFQPISLDDPLAEKAISCWQNEFIRVYPDKIVPPVLSALKQVIAGYRIRLEWNDGESHWGEVTLPVQGDTLIKIEI